MKIAFSKNLEKADVWVIPFWEGPKEAADLPLSIGRALDDFKGKNGETALCYAGDQRILLVGLGKQESATVEALRKAYAAVVKFATSKKWKRIDVLFPKCKQKEEFFKGIAEGILLTHYIFSYKHDSIKEDPPVPIEKVVFAGVEPLKSCEEIETVVNGVHFVRDLVNGNADEKREAFLKAAKHLHPKVKTTVLDKKQIEKEGMGLLLAVNRGSTIDPAFVQAAYTGNPKSKNRIVLVGKGVLYDTGGLSLKPTDGMLAMKCDMAGAATVLGVVKVAAELGLKVNVTAVMPLTENCIDANSYKPGDVYRGLSKKTIEITNTDAEGRLILADAIAYAVKHLRPSAIIDVATLTGACVIALGDDISGLFSHHDELADELLEASEYSDEITWRMPLHADYLESYKSEIADLINSGSREGAAIKAALFLKEFAGDIPWAHIDIAGPAFIPKPKHYNPMKGTGYGLRLLVEFLKLRA
ncbi:MAG: leucyl aminopeptidase [Verrucomicrobia bacterium]|nr:leucyl aminopeptidase [Verrucomicrobiota bacterium]MDE3046785.1 leucyl aminopeptidase [Verrucomicrobiota bacterium]